MRPFTKLGSWTELGESENNHILLNSGLSREGRTARRQDESGKDAATGGKEVRPSTRREEDPHLGSLNLSR